MHRNKRSCKITNRTTISCLLLLSSFFSLNCIASGQEKDLKQLLKTFHKEFVLIEPGKKKFPDSYEAVHPKNKKKAKVSFSTPFYVAKYEVPQNLWREVMGSNPSKWKGERNSVEMFTFEEAVKFCQKTTELLRKEKLIKENQVVRLPTELEWEYLASAGTKTKYYFGDETTKLGDHAWFTGNAAGNDPPVGVKEPNPWGLYDIHGYLWEFTIDSWEKEAPVAALPKESWPPKSKKSILKGGSWKDPAEKLAIRYRVSADAELEDDAVGIRCILTK